MRRYLIILLAFLVSKTEAQTANAGPDQTIYLQQGNSATLDGSGSSGSSFLWKEISTDYSSGGTITSPTSKSTTVTGLPQGVFYFELAATTGGTTKRDSMKVIVDYFTPPKNSNLTLRLPLQYDNFADMVNWRGDTTTYFTYRSGYEKWWQYAMPDGVLVNYGIGQPFLYLERDRQNGMRVDGMGGKLYTTIEDGYGAGLSGTTDQRYSRSTLTYGQSYAFDTLRTYVLDWKAYFPQPIAGNIATIPDWGRVALNGMHGNDDGSGSTTTEFGKDSVDFWSSTMTTDPITGLAGVTLGKSSTWVNQTHTLRIYLREGSGYPGQKGFIKAFLDGVLVHYSNTGKIGKTLMTDYHKLTGLYDYRTLITDPENTTRHKKFSLVTMNSDVWEMNATPTVNAGAAQNISATSTTLSGSATDEGVSGNGTITAYQWTKISGPGSQTFGTPNSATTTVTGLTNGTYQFRLKATDNSSISGYDTVQVVVASAIVAADAGPDQTIYLTQTSNATLDGSSSSGTSFLWKEISTDYTSGATITSPTSKVTTVTGLPQGVFYFELSATTGGTTKRDSMKIIVNYFATPKNSNLIFKLPLEKPDFAYMVNRRDDTTHYLTYQSGKEQYWAYPIPSMPGGNTELWLERDRTNGMMIDSMRGKLYNIIEDGWGASVTPVTGKHYSRSNLTFGSSYKIDTLRTYVYDFQGYFPQDIRANFATTPDWGRVTMTNMHGYDPIDGSGAFQIEFGKDSVDLSERNMITDPHTGLIGVSLGLSSDWVNKTHSVRFYAREGSEYPGQKAFIKIFLDGVQVYYCNNKKIGTTLMQDYYKMTGVYDYRNLITDPDNASRNRKFALVTLNNDIFTLNNTPTVYAGEDQSISISSTTLSGTATDGGVSGNGTITAYEWTKISGPGSPTFGNPNAATTTVSGLSTGTYQFRLKATDNSSISGYDTVQVIVNSAVAAPTLSISGDQNIAVSNTSVYAVASWAATHSGTYKWTQTSGPSAATIESSTSSNTNLYNLVAGTYKFRCTITQDDSQTAYKEVTIVVTEKPVVDAGQSFQLRIPTIFINSN